MPPAPPPAARLRRPHRPRRPRRRRGIAIFVVMSAVLVLGALAAILWGGKNPAPLEQSFEKRQAEYLAWGAQQHALLKCRLLPTELYDAVSYQIGRNPYFHFGLGLKHDISGNELHAEDAEINPGPMFFTGGVSSVERIDDPDNAGKKILKITRTGDPTDPGGKFDRSMSTALEMFQYDISTLFPLADKDQAVIVVSSDPHRDLAMEPEGQWRDPFVGNYKVQTMRILGLQGGRRYDKDTMLITTIGSVKRRKQISIVTNLGGQPKGLSSVRRVTHGGQTADNFGEFDSVFEGQDSYDERMGDENAGLDTNDVFGEDENTASGRRTEIATGIYFVERRATN